MSLVRPLLACLCSLVVVPLAFASPRQDPVAPPPAPKAQNPQAALDKIQRAIDSQDFASAEKDARALVEADPSLYDAWFSLGYALHAQNKIDEALPAHLEAAKSPRMASSAVAHYNAGCAYALKGDKDKALEHLAIAVEKRVNQQAPFAGDPDLKSLIGDPRFDALLTKRKGGAPAPRPAEAAPKFQTIVGNCDRKGSRIVWLPMPIAPATQMHLDWAPVAWADEYATTLEAGGYDGQRWRLGKDFWTTFDTNSDVSFGGVAIPRGAWFLTLVRRDGKILLQFNDPEIVRAARLDPFVADRLPAPAHEVELEVARDQAVVKELTLELQEGTQDLRATFAVAFGPYRLSAPIVATATN